MLTNYVKNNLKPSRYRPLFRDFANVSLSMENVNVSPPIFSGKRKKELEVNGHEHVLRSASNGLCQRVYLPVHPGPSFECRLSKAT